jgi:hypothetical protein
MQPIGRFSYLFCGVLLVVVKFAIDALAAKLFGRQWSAFIYWSPLNLKLFSLSGNERNFAFALAAVSVPFIAVGIWLTVRRLRTLRLHPWLSILFFLPVVNLIFFAFLVAASEFEQKPTDRRSGGWLSVLEEDSMTSLLGAAGIAALCAGLAVWFSIATLGSYGWGVFLAVPFCTGLITTLLVSIPKTRSFGYCVKSSLLAMGITGAGLLAIGFEGLVCLVMCIPIAVPIAMIGVLVAREIIRPGPQQIARHSMVVAGAMMTICPLSAIPDRYAEQPVEIFQVVSSVEIEAPPDRVWPKVIAFPELPPPTDLVFQFGIAYPIRARIEGTGPGAIRYCEFSTGPFVEPITEWQHARLLAFDVTNSPAPMEELSPYKIHPPHLDGFLQSKRGQFRLIPLDGGRRTRLEGTTWYSQALYPSAYWQTWTDAIIHRIHLRVLHHIRTLSERSG